MNKARTILGVSVAGIVLATSAGIGGAYAANLITSKQIEDGTIRKVDLTETLAAKVNQPGPEGPAGPAGADSTVPGPEGPAGPAGADGKDGKDGVSNLIVGAGYTSTWKAGEFGETIETCPEGQYAIGGGYSTWGGYPTNGGYDLGGENTDVQVTVSAPYFKGEYVPVDEAGNFRADQWVVRGFNHGDTDQIVRAWVVCANVAD